MFHIGVFQDDEGVAAAKLHRRRLKVLSSARRDASTGRDAAGQRDALDARVIDDLVGLVMRDQQIGIQADRSARFGQQLLEGDGALRHDARMLYQQNIARHQVRTGDPRKLVIGKIPRLDTEDQTDRAALHMAVTQTRMKFHRCQKFLGVLGVVGEDIGTKLHLSAGLADPLSHLARHDARERVSLFVEERGCLGDNDRPLGIGLVPPGFKAFRGRRDLGLELLVGQGLEFLQDLSVAGSVL